MARTWDEPKELRQRDDEIDELRKEEKHQGLAEMSKNAGHSQGHAGNVGEGVTDKDLTR